jgi:two-component sensor histidine kinase
MLVRDDGAVVLRHPRLPNEAALQLRFTGSLSSSAYRSPADGLERFGSVKPVRGYPVAIVHGVTPEAALALWRDQTVMQGVYAAVAAVAILIVGWAAYLRADQDRVRQEQLDRRVHERTADLERAVTARDLLFKELNHRVKNNFQIVISLLRLQAARAADPKIIAVTEQASTRIAAMAEVHGSLYGSERIGHLEAGRYLEELCRRLVASLAGEDQPSEFVEVEAEPLWLDPDRAIALGLIVNELATNAFKHANTGRTGGIRLRLHRVTAERWRLEVSNDGTDVIKPDGKGAGIGLQLVQGFAKQLGGSVRVDRSHGYRVSVDFPALPGDVLDDTAGLGNAA